MMKVFRRVVVSIVVVVGTTAVNARVIDAQTVEDVDLLTTGEFSVAVPPAIPYPTFELAVGDESLTDEDLPDAPAGGTLTLSFQNHSVGSPPEVERILCPGAERGKRAGVKLRVTGLSAGTKVVASFSMQSATGERRIVTLGPKPLEADSGVRVSVCQKL